VVHARYQLGLALLDRGDAEGAMAQLSAALQLRPDDADAHNALAIALSRQGRREEAIAAFSRALALDPGFEAARRNLELLRAGP
jgi:Flp pilus assembly protein TadD